MVEFHPLIPDRWDAFADLFESDGITRGCWCLWWRVSARGWREDDAAGRRSAFRAAVEDGPAPGIVAMDGGRAVGWVQATPRAAVPRFNGARTGRPVAGTDPERVWALTCFFVRKSHRGTGLMTALAEAACRHAAAQGATAVEAAPIAPNRELVWGEGYVGIAPALARAGFAEVERRTPRRPLMRWTPEGAPA